MTSDHPSKDELADWMAGNLTREESSGVETHLESCDRCARLLATIETTDDPLEKRIRSLVNASQSEAPMSSWEVSVGSVIGPYTIRQRIGEGGMGIVWKAEQTQPVKRIVALKIIKAGMDTKEVIARFESERQALAMMEHPNIARVFEAGTTDQGRPYFVMEYVKGIPITDYCNQSKLTAQQRLELFCDTCAAVQHAHRKGIIHRDIKPTNVLVTLVDGTPLVKVIDFGLAKAVGGRLTEKTLFTSIGEMMGTPAYMSPEQAESNALDVDTRTDVYSLGVLLYELLTGVTPIDVARIQQAGYAELQRIIREVDPPTPSTRLSGSTEDSGAVAQQCDMEPRELVQLLRGDLDVIVMKSLEKDRNRRYESPNEFAADIRRFLNQEPIEARRASTIYRLGRLYQRKKAAFIAVGLIAASLIIGAVTSGVLAVRAIRAERLASDRLDEVEKEQEKTEAALADSELARKKAEEVSQLLVEIFESPDPSRDGVEITIVEMLDGAAARLKTELSDQPDQQAELKLVIARTYASLGLYEKAVAMFRDVADYWSATKGAEDEKTLAVQHSFAGSLTRMGRYDESLAISKRLVDVRTKLYGPNDERTLVARNSLANAMWRGGYAKDANESVLRLRKDLVDRARKELGPQALSTLVFMGNLANSHAQLGNHDEALSLREFVLVAYREQFGEHSPRALFALEKMVSGYRKSNDFEAALPVAEELSRLRESVLGTEHKDTLHSKRNYAELLLKKGELDQAVQIFEPLLEIRRRTEGLHIHGVHFATLELIKIYGLTGQHEKALLLGQEFVAYAKRKLGPEHVKVDVGLRNTAQAVAGLPGATADQLTQAQQLAIELCQWKPRVGRHQCILGTIHYRLQNYEAALEILKKASQLSKGDPISRYLTAMTYWQMNQPELAREQLAIAEEKFAARQKNDVLTLAHQREARALIQD